MTFPTPTGAAPPLTGFTDADTVSYISGQLPASKRASYVAYYRAALAQDPAITPFQAYAAWATGETVAAGVAGVAGVEVGIPQAAATGAEKAVSTLTAPLTGIDAIGAFFNDLGSANTWIRVAKVVVGGVLLIVGLVHITGADNAVADAARKVPLPI